MIEKVSCGQMVGANKKECKTVILLLRFTNLCDTHFR